jgi:ankyrin repeat protein
VQSVALDKVDAVKGLHKNQEKQSLTSNGLTGTTDDMTVLDATIDMGDDADQRFNGLSDGTNSNLQRHSGRSAFTDAHQSRRPERESQYSKPSTGDLDLNMIGSSGFNCLHAACGSGNIEMTEYLLFKRKVNPNTLGKDNWSPIEIAVQTGILEIV